MNSKLLIGGLLASVMILPALAQSNPPSANPPANRADTVTTAPKTAGNMWRASKLKGLDVYNDKNEKLGDINEILLDKSGKVDGVVIGVGGFLGMGEHDIAVSMDKLKFKEEAVRMSATTTSTTTRESTTGAATTTAPARTTTANANDWTPDHAVMSATKDQLKALPQFKYSDYN